MDKLIEPLNEYEEDSIKNSEWLNVMYIWKNEWTLHYYDNYKDENIFDNVRLKIISKEYWFIKRLLDNDKIDFLKLDDDSNWYDIDTGREYLDILALLSIQDNPIEFLISILK